MSALEDYSRPITDIKVIFGDKVPEGYVKIERSINGRLEFWGVVFVFEGCTYFIIIILIILIILIMKV